MEFLVDTHCHTIASGHAYSTLIEIVKESRKKRLKMIAITDHGPQMPGGPHIFHIANQRVYPEFIEGVEILRGVEANIIDYEGNIDISERVLKKMDIVIASLHDVCIEPGSVEENTRALLKAMENNYVDIIAHPGNPSFKINIDKVIEKAKETDTLIEINNSSLNGSRKGSYDNCIKIAKECKENKVKVVLGSDAHIAYDVGEFGKVVEMLKKMNMPEELIINASPENLKTYLKSKGKQRYKEDTLV